MKKVDKNLLPAGILTLAITAVAVIANGRPVWIDTSIVIAIYGLLALSVGMSYGQAGILSVAQAAFSAVGAYTTAVLCLRFDISPFWTLVPSMLVPALIAYPLARVVTRLSPLALGIATLVFGNIVSLALREGGSITGGYVGLSGIPPVPFLSTPERFHLFAWSVVILVVYMYTNLVTSAHGRALVTVRTDALRAAADGVDVGRELARAFALSAAIAGLAGWLYAHYTSYVGPDSLGSTLSLSVLLMTVVGGVRAILGPVLGAAALTVLFRLIPGQEVQGMFYGGILIAVLLVSPRGLLGFRYKTAASKCPTNTKEVPSNLARSTT